MGKIIKELIAFHKDIVKWSLSGGIVYQIYLCILVAFMLLGVYAYFVQVKVGLAVTNMSDIVSWGFYIANFTFLVGVAAAAVMIILPSYIFKDKDLHKVVIVGEVVAIGPGRVSDNGDRLPMEVSQGDRVLYGKYSGSEVNIDDEKFIILRESDVLAVL